MEATGAEAVRILPSAPQGAASAAYLDRVVKAHVPRCFSDGREGMEFPTLAGPLRMQWNEGGAEGFQVTVRLAAAQIRREGQLPSAVVGQGPITTALEAAAVPLYSLGPKSSSRHTTNACGPFHGAFGGRCWRFRGGLGSPGPMGGADDLEYASGRSPCSQPVSGCLG